MSFLRIILLNLLIESYDHFKVRNRTERTDGFDLRSCDICLLNFVSIVSGRLNVEWGE